MQKKKTQKHKNIQKFSHIYLSNDYDPMEPLFDWMKSCIDLKEKGQKYTNGFYENPP